MIPPADASRRSISLPSVSPSSSSNCRRKVRHRDRWVRPDGWRPAYRRTGRSPSAAEQGLDASVVLAEKGVDEPDALEHLSIRKSSLNNRPSEPWRIASQKEIRNENPPELASHPRFPPRRNHLATGGPSRRPPSAGCADRRSAQFPCLRVAPPGGLGAMRQFSVRVAPSATPQALPRLRNPDERCLPFQYTDHAERWDSRREGTTSQLGVLPAARLRRAVPAPTGRTGQRSAPCLRVAPPGEPENGVCPMYGSHRTGIPGGNRGVLPAARLRRAVPAPTGRTGQRSAQFSRWGLPCLRVAPLGGMGAMRQFSVRVAPSATRRALRSMRNAG